MAYPQMDTLTLSLGSGLRKTYRELNDMPSGTEARLNVWDNSGAIIGEFRGYMSTQSRKIIEFAEPEDYVSAIPHGASFALYVEYPGLEPVMSSYGTVVRLEPRFPLAPATDITDTAMQWVDNFNRSYPGPKWVPLGGKVNIHNGSSLGPNYPGFNKAAARYVYPMMMDSVTIVVKVNNMGAGKFNVMLCGDFSMTQWLGVQFETGLVNNKMHIVTGNGPTDWNETGTVVNNTTVSGQVYTIKYNHLLNTVSVYKGSALTPMVEWTDDSNVLTHGEGFRYTGLGWSTSLFAPGVEPTDWEARDGV